VSIVLLTTRDWILINHVVRYTNTSTTTSSSSITACTSCTVTAYESFLTYPSTLSTVNVSVTVTKVPYVTIHADGSSETNYQTVTQSSNVTGIFSGTGSVNPYATLTWEVDGVILLGHTEAIYLIAELTLVEQNLSYNLRLHVWHIGWPLHHSNR
jgi:hypothetical protein